MQHTADGLAADGLITFGDNPHHRRAKLMWLTPKGRTALAYVAVRHAEWANRIGSGQSAEALRAAVEVLRSLRDKLEHDRLR